MTHPERNDDTPAVDDEVEERLDGVADDKTQEPHHDEDERRRRQQAAEEAESNPRRGA
jgi:hypothetical protein